MGERGNMKGCEANKATCRTPISALTATGAGEMREVGSCPASLTAQGQGGAAPAAGEDSSTTPWHAARGRQPLVVDFCWDVALLVNNHANAWTSHHDEPCTKHG